MCSCLSVDTFRNLVQQNLVKGQFVFIEVLINSPVTRKPWLFFI